MENSSIQLTKKQTIIFSLLILWGAGVYWKIYFSASALTTVYALYLLYYLFYTKLPKIFWFYFALGIVLFVWNWLDPYPLSIGVYTTLAISECFRVILMAIFTYPSMIKSLQSLTEELEKRVEDRTTELQEANRQLQAANEKLHELDRMKSAFVSQASHDLRTPLAAIKGSLDNMALGVGGGLSDKQKQILQRASRSVNRLTHLINDLLDLSRIESGRVILEKFKIPFRNLVENMIHENKPTADYKKITLTFSADSGSFPILADHGKIERVVGELIGNAIKYTPEQGTVSIHLSTENPNVCLAIRDSGIGMTKEECGKIWERFYRTPQSKQFAKGSGLGLSIAKELVEMHGGKISVESEPGQGSTFTVCIPGVSDEIESNPPEE